MSVGVVRGGWALGACLLVVAGCKNPPAEPAPVVRSPEVRTERASPAPEALVLPRAAADRCVEPLAETAPASAPAPVLDARCPREPQPTRRFRKRPLRVGGEALTVELALSEPEREQGLMYRRSLGEHEGMLFDLGVAGRHQFWMHDTCIPLDIGFLADDGTLVGVAESAAPLTDTPRGVRCTSRYVLEVPAGWYRKHGVLPGTRIDLGE